MFFLLFFQAGFKINVPNGHGSSYDDLHWNECESASSAENIWWVFELKRSFCWTIWLMFNFFPFPCSGVEHVAAIPDLCFTLQNNNSAESEALFAFIEYLNEDKPYPATIQVIRWVGCNLWRRELRFAAQLSLIEKSNLIVCYCE